MCAAALVHVCLLHAEYSASLLNDLLVAKLFSGALNFISPFSSRPDNINIYLHYLYLRTSSLFQQFEGNQIVLLGLVGMLMSTNTAIENIFLFLYSNVIKA